MMPTQDSVFNTCSVSLIIMNVTNVYEKYEVDVQQMYFIRVNIHINY